MVRPRPGPSERQPRPVLAITATPLKASAGKPAVLAGGRNGACGALEMRQQHRDGLPLFGGKWTRFQ